MTPLVIAHRGASKVRPENTVEAFRHAAVLGADWVELDVRLTADGGLAVHHDAVLPDGRALDSLRVAELPPSVPQLDAALEACGSMGVNIEIKHEPGTASSIASAVVEAARAWGGTVLVSSFDAGIVDRVRAVDAELPVAELTMLLDREPAAVVADCVARGLQAWNPHHGTLDADAVAVAHDAGIAVYTWTADDPDRIRQLASWNVDGIVTNVPDVALAALRSGGNR